MYDIVHEIHGLAVKLKTASSNPGYVERNGFRRNCDPARHVIYLDDFIDCGLDNRGLIRAGHPY